MKEFSSHNFMQVNKLNICLSFQGMLNTVKAVSEFHDVEAQYWSESVKEYMQKQEV